jgi:hypothetical protein
MPHYSDDMEDDYDFPMMAKRKMMRAMKAKKMEGQDSPKMEKETEMSLIKVEIKIGDSGKEKK